MKKILLILFIFISISGYSQISTATMITNINDTVYQNTTHKITGDGLNGVLKTMVSYINGHNSLDSAIIAGYSLLKSVSTTNITLKLDTTKTATANKSGLLSFTDWQTFNNKQNQITAHSPLTLQGGTEVSVLNIGTIHAYLHGNASGYGGYSAIDLTQDVTGLLPDGNISSAATWNAKQSTITATPPLYISSNVISSHRASATDSGYVSTGTQTLAGDKTLSGNSTLGGNVTFTPTVNSSLTGANQRVPSHATANITFTNASLASIGSANNGGVTGGHTFCVSNETGAGITIVNNYASAAAGEAIYTGKGADVIVPNHGTFWLQYNSTASAWESISSGSIPLSTGVTGILPIANGGSNASTIAAARVNFGIDKLTNGGNTNYNILATDKVAATGTAFTAPRTWTLPDASTVNAGQEIYVADVLGTVTSSNTLTIAVQSGQKLNSTTNGTEVIGSAGGWRRLISNGVDTWAFDAGILRASKNLSDVASATTSVTNLGLSSATSLNTGSFGVTYDGMGGVITTNNYTSVTIPYAGTITKWYVSSIDPATGSALSGSIVADIKRSGTSIIGAGNKPTLTSASSANATVSSWTSTSVSANDELIFYVVSATTCVKAIITIIITKQ